MIIFWFVIYLITSIVIFNTLKLTGSSFRLFLSVMQMRMMKITRYDSCESTRFSAAVFPLFFLISDCSGLCSSGRNEVYGGRYLSKLFTVIGY